MAGWARGDGSSLGRIKFRQQHHRILSSENRSPWFAFWLKDKGSSVLSEGNHFSDRFERMEELRPVAPVNLRLQSANSTFTQTGKLVRSARADSQSESIRQLHLRPANPVPYRQRPVEPT
ncbi:MAG: hypothetical protein IPJ07_20495 [Acidobacteria bacterium]|nr:hypothetical protein [Acidobacteriota bacterium]